MLWITVDLLSAKLPRAAARVLDGTKAPSLQLINCGKVRR